MASSVDNVKLGVCTIWYNGIDLGYTKGGVEVEVQTTTHEVKVDQFGETPVSELITGRTISVKTPLAETTLENLVAIMPGSELVSDGAKAKGTVTIGVNNKDGDKITIGAQEFVLKDTLTGASSEVKRGTNHQKTGDNFIEKLHELMGETYTATRAGMVITIEAKQRGVAGNAVVSKIGTDITVTNITGGVDVTMAAVRVNSGININLLDTAKTLVLRPIGTNGEDDLTVYRAACPGALNFAYQTDNERVYQADFKGYVKEDGSLFAIGDTKAFATP